MMTATAKKLMKKEIDSLGIIMIVRSIQKPAAASPTAIIVRCRPENQWRRRKGFLGSDKMVAVHSAFAYPIAVMMPCQNYAKNGIVLTISSTTAQGLLPLRQIGVILAKLNWWGPAISAEIFCGGRLRVFNCSILYSRIPRVLGQREPGLATTFGYAMNREPLYPLPLI